MLFAKEFKRVVCSKMFVIYFAAMFFFAFYTQFWHDMGMDGMDFSAPVPGGVYGMTVVDDPEMLAQNATAWLLNEYTNNRFTTYPYGFIHVVRLKGSDREKMSIILGKLTGFDDPEEYVKKNFPTKSSYSYSMDETFNEYDIPELNVLSRVSIEEVRALMTEADNILGGGSDYSPEEIDYNFSVAPMPYEEALAEYNGLIYEDKITNGYARLFCDYFGIDLALIPVFLIAVFVSADKRSKMEQLIYSRSVSTTKLTLARFAALVAAEMLPVLFSAVLANFRVAQFYGAEGLDWLAMFKYSFIWLLPSAIAITGIDMLLMSFVHYIAVVVANFGVWFFVAMCSPRSTFGVFDIIIRHNTAYGRQEFIDQLPTFTANRLFFTGLGLACAVCSVFVFNLRREGKLGGNKLPGKMFARKSEKKFASAHISGGRSDRYGADSI